MKFSDDLKDKKVFVWAEQGLGDVFIWSWLLRKLAEDTDHAKVQCEPRLKSLLSRSFPNIEFIDKNLHQIAETESLASFDANMLLISLGKYYYQDIYALLNKEQPVTASLKADHKLVAEYGERLTDYRDMPLVGLCWRSSVNDYKRDVHYLNYEDVVTLFKDIPCRIVNLQYSTTDVELDYLREHLGDRFIHFDDIDLRNDQESVAALIMNCDFVVSAPTAVNALAGALGQKLLSTAGAWLMGLHHPFFPDIKSIGNTNIAVQDIDYFRMKIMQQIQQ